MALACAQRDIAYLAYMASGGPHGAALTVAGRRGVSVHRVLLAWLRAQSPNIVPLVGASKPASIRDSAALLDLTGEDLAGLRAGQPGPVSNEHRPAARVGLKLRSRVRGGQALGKARTQLLRELRAAGELAVAARLK